MTNAGINVDDKEVLKALSRLSFKQMDKAYRTGMKKSLDPILKQTKLNLRKSDIKNVNKPYISKKTGKRYISMMQGVKTSVYIGNTEDSYGKVHIMKEFRLKWFEKGTSLRKTARGASRGSIQPRWFFRAAVMQRSNESTETLEENIRNSILKAYNKK
jgi:hypothetical protein